MLVGRTAAQSDESWLTICEWRVSHFPCPPLKQPKLVTNAHTLDWQTGCQKTLILRIWGHLGPVWERRLNCCLSIKVTGLHQTWRVFPLIFLVWGDNWMGQYRFRYQDHNLNVRRKGVIEWDQAYHSKKIIPQTILNSFLNLSPNQQSSSVIWVWICRVWICRSWIFYTFPPSLIGDQNRGGGGEREERGHWSILLEQLSAQHPPTITNL